MGPEYLVLAAAATATSTFARQLAAMARSLRKRRSEAQETARGGVQRVEVRLRQEDGTYRVAAEGQVGDAAVQRIIDEIAED